ncbi:3-hydroxylacyl-ACP dehydratase, partial [Pseudomonas syringae pv. actinidiae]|nr:3-hydroxylacyl-ACP dehydratase [Pseudomonas syringae pv. actinidiae]
MIEWQLAELIPHAGDMILIDQVLDFDEEQINTRLTVRADGLFNQPDGSLPAWLGIELMAQSVAAYAGCQARSKGEAVKLGFLLGSRKFDCNVARFPAAWQRTAHSLAVRSLQDVQRHGCVRMHLTGPDITAFARLNVYCPPNTAD